MRDYIVVSFSGGKDSTALLLRLIELGEHIDEVVCCDWEGLYEIFDRVSCWCCPLRSLEENRKLRKYFPDLWKELADMDGRNWNQFRKDYSVEQLDIRFQLEEERTAQGLPVGRTKAFREALKQRFIEKGVL